MVAIPSTPPQPINLLKALDSVKAIGKIFKDQGATYYQFEPIYVSAPFKLTDARSFEDDIIYRTGTKEKLIIDKLTEIQKWAKGNIKQYERIKTKTLEGRKEKYYNYTDFGLMEANNQTAEDFVLYPDNPQMQNFILFDLLLFSREILSLVDKFLENPFEPKQPVAQVKTEQQPTNVVKALFSYYLIHFEKVKKPRKKDFKEFVERYHFTCTSTDIYNICTKLLNKKPSEITDIKTAKYLTEVIKLLEPYPTALRAADNDLYRLNNPQK